MTTVRELLARRVGDDRPGLLFEDRRWSWREHVADAAALASGLGTPCGADRCRYVGALPDDVPKMAQRSRADQGTSYTLVRGA